MSNKFDDFSDVVVDNLEVNRDRPDFKLYQLKVEHYYWNSEVLEVGMPVNTSIELTYNYNLKSKKDEWKKILSHTYLRLEKENETTTNTYEEIIENADELIKQLQKFDLRDLKNNYFSEKAPEKFTHWELTYNNYFKIVGTYDQVMDEFEKISDILHLNEIVKTEIKKTQNELAKKYNSEVIEDNSGR